MHVIKVTGFVQKKRVQADPSTPVTFHKQTLDCYNQNKRCPLSLALHPANITGTASPVPSPLGLTLPNLIHKPLKISDY